MNVTMVILCAFPSLPVAFVFIAYAVYGVVGGPATQLMAIFAYTADVTSRERRTFGVGMVRFSRCGDNLCHRFCLASVGLC